MRTRILTGVGLLMILALAATAFAQNQEQPEKYGKNAALRHQFQENTAQIKQNRAEIQNLIGQVREEGLLLRERLKKMRDDPENIDQGERSRIRECLRLISSNRRELKQTIGQVYQHSLQLRHNRRNHNFNGCLENLDNILAVQQARIRLLNKILSDMKAL